MQILTTNGSDVMGSIYVHSLGTSMDTKLMQKSEFQFLEDAKTLSISEMFPGNMLLSKNTPSYPVTFCFSIGAKQW